MFWKKWEYTIIFGSVLIIAMFGAYQNDYLLLVFSVALSLAIFIIPLFKKWKKYTDAKKSDMVIERLLQEQHYFRYVAIYQCQCSYYNDQWQDKSDCEKICPEHAKPLEMVFTTIEQCERPSDGRTVKTTLKANINVSHPL
ncbi:hypothetical protein [Vibrio maritimus]|uniref:hypothetical protein n=1 Tax=Vibrio maritimus TaxID=990268 RepID=UPI001F43B4F6|nr:hypothetical protein [Vibrio maritimus]